MIKPEKFDYLFENEILFSDETPRDAIRKFIKRRPAGGRSD